MATALRDDAAFRYTESGQDYLHHLGAVLRRPTQRVVQTVYSWESADFTTIRRVAIGSNVYDLTCTLRYDGSAQSLADFLAAGMRGASLEYFPSLASPALSFPCVLMEHSDIRPDRDFDFDFRYEVDVRLRRTDGNTWDSLVQAPLFYYKAGMSVPGLTFTRSGAIGKYVNEDGVVQEAAANIFRTTWLDTDDDDAVDTPHLVLEAARTNLNDDDDLSNATQWAVNNTPVITATVSDPAGGTGAYTVADDDATNQEFIQNIVAFTGDAVKSVVFVVRENTMPGSGNQGLKLRQTSGTPADLLDLNITSWSNGDPQITATNGTLLGKRYIGNGYWAIYGQTASVTAAETNRIQILPAVTANQTGSIDVWRVMAFDDAVPLFSILDEAEAIGEETFYATANFVPQELTAYVKCREFGCAEEADQDNGARGLLHVGGSTNTGDPRFHLRFASDGTAEALFDNGVASVDASAGSKPTYGQVVELRGVLSSDGSVTVGVSIDSGAEATASSSAPSGGLVATDTGSGKAWNDTRVYLGSLASVRGIAVIEEIKIMPGTKTMAEMRKA